MEARTGVEALGGGGETASLRELGFGALRISLDPVSDLLELFCSGFLFLEGWGFVGLATDFAVDDLAVRTPSETAAAPVLVQSERGILLSGLLSVLSALSMSCHFTTLNSSPLHQEKIVGDSKPEMEGKFAEVERGL